MIKDTETKSAAYVRSRDDLWDKVVARSSEPVVSEAKESAIRARMEALPHISRDETIRVLDHNVNNAITHRNTIIVEQSTLSVSGSLSQTVQNKAKKAVAEVKAAMEKAGIQDVTDRDASLVVAAMVAAENGVTDMDKVGRQPLTFAFSRGEIEQAVARVREQAADGKRPADILKAGQHVNPTTIVGPMTREGTQRQ
jgi:hypothetical protein